MKYKTFNSLESFMTNTYLVWSEISKEAVIIDPSSPDFQIKDVIEELGLKIKFIINTHGHADHIGGNSYFKDLYNCDILIHKDDAEMLVDNKKSLAAFIDPSIKSYKADRFLYDNDEITFGDINFRVIHTPGHTPGGISLYFENVLFSGDTLFNHSVGRTDLPGGNSEILFQSIKQKLFTLPERTIVLPGHGEHSYIEDEIVGNPFVGILS